MRAIVRVGLVLGSVGFLALFALQHAFALAVAPLLVIVGLLAGVCMAKWLEWGWYGSQFRAGAYAGFYACALAGGGGLLSLVTAGPHDVQSLAAASHLGGLSLAPIIEGAAIFGWIGVDIVLLLICGLLGVFAGGFGAQILAMSKSARTVRVVTQAHVAAEPLARRDTFLPTPSGARAGDTLLPSPRSQPGFAASPSNPGFAASPSNPGADWGTPAPVAPPPQPAWQTSANTPAARRTAARQVATKTPPPQPAVQPPAPAPAQEQQPKAQPPKSQPRDGRLSAAEREALDAWARENEPKPETPSRKRQPKASEYLNGPAPAKRSRKKQDTRDWLC